MKRIFSLLTISAIALSSLALVNQQAAAQQNDRINFNDVQDGEQNVKYKFWVCIFGCPKTAITSVRLDTITSVSKHTYNVVSVNKNSTQVENQTVREVTIDTTGNNSIRIYCPNINKEQQRYKDRLKNTREFIDKKTGTDSHLPSKKFPEGTYSHNVEYQVDKAETLDTIYDSVMNAIIKNKGCTLKVK
ncbi:MAG: hypothetical protein Q4F35_08400 [Akkermansia sp.]|nr:hypothetical protein [Akkermansia sp.]